MTLCPVTNSKGRACIRPSGHHSRHRYDRPAGVDYEMPTMPQTLPYTTWASALCGDHIGLMVSVVVHFQPSDVTAIVHGELRQLDHRAGEVIVNLTGPDGVGALEELNVHPTAHVYIS